MGLLRASAAPAAAAAAPAAPKYDSLIAALAAADPAARRSAARGLAAYPGAVPALAAALAVERDRPVQQAVVGTLTTIADPAAVAALTGLLRSDNAWVRNAVSEGLQAIGSAALAAVRAQLADPDPCARIAAVVTLSGLPAPESEPMLIDAIAGEEAVNVLAAIVEALDIVGGPAALPALQSLAQSDTADPFVAFAATAVHDRLASGAR